MTAEESIQKHLRSTAEHRARVHELMYEFANQLIERASKHDFSKTRSPELEGFADLLEVLEKHPYGSPEYQESLKSGVIEHHYSANRHHPEHHKDGINGMDLLDFVEMWFDWRAACERRPDGDIKKSVEINEARFGPCSAYRILENTINAK
jgi:hypothetical protein